jgi:hypothetical protein
VLRTTAKEGQRSDTRWPMRRNALSQISSIVPSSPDDHVSFQHEAIKRTDSNNAKVAASSFGKTIALADRWNGQKCQSRDDFRIVQILAPPRICPFGSPSPHRKMSV